MLHNKDPNKSYFPFMKNEVSELLKKATNDTILWADSDSDYNLNNEKFLYYYNEIIRICDLAFNEIKEKYKETILNHEELIRDYENVKVKFSEAYPRNDNHRGDTFKNKLSDITTHLLCHYRITYEYDREESLQKNANLSDEEVESICVYLQERNHIKIDLDLLESRKNTLLAMKTIDKFARENAISSQHTIELFSEYLGKQFVFHHLYDEDTLHKEA